MRSRGRSFEHGSRSRAPPGPTAQQNAKAVRAPCLKPAESFRSARGRGGRPWLPRERNGAEEEPSFSGPSLSRRSPLLERLRLRRPFKADFGSSSRSSAMSSSSFSSAPRCAGREWTGKLCRPTRPRVGGAAASSSISPSGASAEHLSSSRAVEPGLVRAGPFARSPKIGEPLHGRVARKALTETRKGRRDPMGARILPCAGASPRAERLYGSVQTRRFRFDNVFSSSEQR